MTLQQLHAIAPLSPDITEQFNTVTSQYSITNLPAFVANTVHESNQYRTLSENLNYSADRLIQVWPHRFSNQNAMDYAHNPQKLANMVYGKRLGNVQPNDGYNFRGSGVIQLTGRENHTKFTIYYNKRFGTNYTIEAMAELLRTDITFGLHSACWIFEPLDKLQFINICKGINGGLVGYDERLRLYELSESVLAGT